MSVGADNETSVFENRLSGTYPSQATFASLIGSSVEVSRVVSNATADLPISGTLITGGETEEETAEITSEIVSTEPTVYYAAATVKKCGTQRCGNKNKEV